MMSATNAILGARYGAVDMQFPSSSEVAGFDEMVAAEMFGDEGGDADDEDLDEEEGGGGGFSLKKLPGWVAPAAIGVAAAGAAVGAGLALTRKRRQRNRAERQSADLGEVVSGEMFGGSGWLAPAALGAAVAGAGIATGLALTHKRRQRNRAAREEAQELADLSAQSAEGATVEDGYSSGDSFSFNGEEFGDDEFGDDEFGDDEFGDEEEFGLDDGFDEAMFDEALEEGAIDEEEAFGGQWYGADPLPSHAVVSREPPPPSVMPSPEQAVPSVSRGQAGRAWRQAGRSAYDMAMATNALQDNSDRMNSTLSDPNASRRQIRQATRSFVKSSKDLNKAKDKYQDNLLSMASTGTVQFGAHLPDMSSLNSFLTQIRNLDGSGLENKTKEFIIAYLGMAKAGWNASKFRAQFDAFSQAVREEGGMGPRATAETEKAIRLIEQLAGVTVAPQDKEALRAIGRLSAARILA